MNYECNMIFLRDIFAKLGNMSAIFAFKKKRYGIDSITSNIFYEKWLEYRHVNKIKSSKFRHH